MSSERLHGMFIRVAFSHGACNPGSSSARDT